MSYVCSWVQKLLPQTTKRKEGAGNKLKRISLANPHTLKSTHHPTKEDAEGCEFEAAPTCEDAIRTNQARRGRVDQAGTPGLVAKTQNHEARTRVEDTLMRMRRVLGT